MTLVGQNVLCTAIAMREEASKRGRGEVKVKKVEGFARNLLFAVAWCLACVVIFSGRQLYVQVGLTCHVLNMRICRCEGPRIWPLLPSSL